jgi:L-seryl-tRNA(Ser) seleniumtransferase
MLNMSPQEDRIGRPCKVGKETIFALLKALENFVNQDYDATLRMYDARAQVITDAVKRFGVTALPRQFNPQALGNVTPRYSWQIDPAKLKITGQGMRGRDPGAPPGGAGAGSRHDCSGRLIDPNIFGFAVWQLKTARIKSLPTPGGNF